jgi:mono/diheme cytochrome c family protein
LLKLAELYIFMRNSIHMLNKITPVALILLIVGFVSCTAGKQATSAALTYTTNVKPIIDANCASTCHNAGRPAAGIDLTTYEKVKEQTLTGKLIIAIQHADGAKPMPKKAPKMDDATIQTIVNWASSGAAQ